MADVLDIANAMPLGGSRKRRLRLATAVMACGACAGTAGATDYAWNGVGGTALWSTPGSWSPSGPPGSGDNVVASANTTNINLDLTATTVTNWSNTAGNVVQAQNASGAALTISGLLSKSGAGTTLNFRNDTGAGQVLTLYVGQVTVSAGILSFGTSTRNSNITMGSVGLGGTGVMSFATQVSAGTLLGTINGTLTMTGTSVLNAAGQGTSGSGFGGELRIGALESLGTTGAFIQANTNGSSPYLPVIVLNATSGTANFGGVIRDNGGMTANTVSIVKENGSTQIFSNNNIYRGSTTINGGTLLVNNDQTGSGTGTGRVIVNSGGTLGGTGRISPSYLSGGITVASGGTIAPGNGGVGNLTINLSATTGTVLVASGAEFDYELGTPSGSPVGLPGASDRLTFTGAAANDVAFNNNVIDFGGTGTPVTPSLYKLFDSSLVSGTAWTGLTLSGQNITGGLSFTGLNPAIENAYLFRGNGAIGDFDDIYIVVPEPGSATIVLGALGLGLLRRRRTRV